MSASDSRSPLISATAAALPSSKRARTITVNLGGSRSAPTTPKKQLDRPHLGPAPYRPAPDLEPELDSRIAGARACQPVLEQARHPFPEQYDVLDLYG